MRLLPAWYLKAFPDFLYHIEDEGLSAGDIVDICAGIMEARLHPRLPMGAASSPMGSVMIVRTRPGLPDVLLVVSLTCLVCISGAILIVRTLGYDPAVLFQPGSGENGDHMTLLDRQQWVVDDGLWGIGSSWRGWATEERIEERRQLEHTREVFDAKLGEAQAVFRFVSDMVLLERPGHD